MYSISCLFVKIYIVIIPLKHEKTEVHASKKGCENHFPNDNEDNFLKLPKLFLLNFFF